MTQAMVGVLVERACVLSSRVASFLHGCEDLLDKDIRLVDLAPTELIAQVARTKRFTPMTTQSLPELRGLGGSEPDLDERLAGLVLHHWPRSRADVVRRTAKRPDVLALTCALLAAPAAPHTRYVAQFAVTLALRSLYGILADTEAVSALRGAYDDLASRFAKKARRIRIGAGGTESFLIDLACMTGWIYRSSLRDQLSSYYESFAARPLGVDLAKRERPFHQGTLPQLRGQLPDFSTLLSMAYTQPFCVPGLDAVTGGLLPVLSQVPDVPTSGGLISLVAGPPGSGKTTFCLTVARRMAELGAQVVYVTTEELTRNLETKCTALIDSRHLAHRMLRDPLEIAPPRFRIEEGRDLARLEELVDEVVEDLEPVARTSPQPGEIFLPHPRVLVIDSLTPLLQRTPSPGPEGGDSEAQGNAKLRSQLAAQLNQLRDHGVTVFMVGERGHMHDDLLGYLADNVLLLGVDETASQKHPARIFDVAKTRLQPSRRGRHVLHISGRDGLSVSPSLHAVLHGTDARRPRTFVSPGSPASRAPNETAGRRVVLWAGPAAPASAEPGGPRVISLRDGTHSFLYGWGPIGKAGLALALTFEPRQSTLPRERYDDYLSRRANGVAAATDAAWLQRARTLVVSFLYDGAYYHDIARRILRKRHGSNSEDRAITVLDLYPGFLDPESLIARIRRALESGRLAGRPYTGVVVDGIHNMLMQYPLLAREELFWPALFGVLHAERVLAITTFTFFKITSNNPEVEAINQASVPSDALRMFHHLLVSNCDYTMLATSDRGRVLVERVTNVDGAGEDKDFVWNPTRMCFRPASVPNRRRSLARGR